MQILDQLEAVGGLAYLISLDDGLPQISNLEGYVRIVKDKAVLRRIIFTSQSLIDRAMIGQEAPDDLLAAARELSQGADEAILPLVKKAIDKEGDPDIKPMLEMIAAAMLAGRVHGVVVQITTASSGASWSSASGRMRCWAGRARRCATAIRSSSGRARKSRRSWPSARRPESRCRTGRPW